MQFIEIICEPRLQELSSKAHVKCLYDINIPLLPI